MTQIAVKQPPPKRRFEAFTLPHFKLYTSRIVLDHGDAWELEDFQEDIVEPILAGVKECWTILPEGNAKTTLLAGVALYHCDYTLSPWVPIAASSRDQAEIMARQAYDMIRRSPGMEQRFRIYEGYREIRSRTRGGRGIKVYAADTTTADGVIPTLAICDEGHRHPDMSLYRLWRGKLLKRNGQIVMISTAGEPGSEFETNRDKIRDSAPDREVKGCHVRSRGRNIVMNEWRVQNAADITNMEKVKEANPLEAIQIEDLEDAFLSPTMDLGDWKRLKCNIPARSSGAAVSDEEWDNNMVSIDIPEGEHVDVGVDVAWKFDTFAITPLWRELAENVRILGDAEILTPPRDGSMLSVDKVKGAFLKIYDRNPIDFAVMDIARAEDIAQWLEDELHVRVIDRTQGNVMAAEDFESFMKGLRDGTLLHTGHGGLRAHVSHAIVRQLPGGAKRFERPSQSRAKKKQDERVIDALTAAAMVNHYAMATEEDELAGEVEDYRITSV